MLRKLALLTSLLLTWNFVTLGQNLPSLLTGRDINSTFSIIAYDEKAQEWGIAVATDNIYVGNSTIYIKPGLGAFSVIAETEPRYAIEGFEKLKEGKSIEASITEVRLSDSQAHVRQVSGIDANGRVYAFTGNSLKYWNGNSAVLLSANYVVMGNQLTENVLSEMSKTYESAQGTLAQRLFESLQAGQYAGGQISGKQSAAIVVKGLKNEWYNQIDLRVDNSKTPIKELKTLLDYHYGRILLNQSLYAIRKGNNDLAKKKLINAEIMLEGWTGIYSKIAQAYIALKNEDAAVNWIKKGLSENTNWEVNLPAFYILRNHPEMKSLIASADFSERDWENAIRMMSTLGRELEVIELAHALLKKKTETSYLNYLLGRGYFYEKESKKAVKYLKRALVLDKENIEAQRLLDKVQENTANKR